MMALILRFLYIGLFSIGGGLSAISLIQAEIVDRLGWLTAETLVDIMAIAEMTPGPIAVNAASFVGMNLYGFPGAVVATVACIFPGCIISYLISRANEHLRENARWRSALNILRAAVVGIVVTGGLTILKNALWMGDTGPDILAAIYFCLGLGIYRRQRCSPLTFMAAMGVCVGALRLGLPLVWALLPDFF